MDRSSHAQHILACENRLGEEPVWHGKSQTVYWVDTINPGRIFAYHPQSQNTNSWEFEHPILALALHSNGDFLVAGRKTIWLWSPQTEIKIPFAHIETDLPENRINCMAVDHLGNLWVATMQNNVTDMGEPIEITGFFGSLYRVAPAGIPMKMASDYACPNTMLWSLDGKYFYFGDSGTGWIYRYACDLDAGCLGKRSEFFRAEGLGIPDGSTIDMQGYLWNARWGSNCLVRISPTGELVQKISVGARQPTCCVFGGRNLNTLYITSARFGMDASLVSGNDGALFSYRPDVGGIAANYVKD